MRICLHTFWEVTHDFIGGTERFLIELSKELRSLGYEAYIACTGPAGCYSVEGIDVIASVPEAYGERLAKYGSAKPAFLQAEIIKGDDWNGGLQRLSAFVQQQLVQQTADVFHLNSFAAASFVDLPASTIVTNHENAQESDFLWGNGFFDFLTRKAASGETRLHRHHALAVPSRYYAKTYSAAMGMPVTAVKQGVRLETFPIARSLPHRSASRPARLLLPSRFEPQQKGHDLAVQACRYLLDHGQAVEMTFSGIRDDHAEKVAAFQALLRQYDVAAHIRMKRFADICDAYAECDIVISPERFCSYGLSVSESLAIGIPTVLSDIPTYREIAAGTKHAYFFKADDPASLAESIMAAMADLGLRRDVGAIKFRIANDLRECAKRYSEMYLQAVGA